MTEEQELERHYGKGEPFECDGKKYDLELLDIEQATDYMKVFKSFMKQAVDDKGKEKNINVQEIFNALDDDTVEAAKRLIIKTIDLTYPGKEDIAIVKKLRLVKNFFNLFMWVLQNNSDMAAMANKDTDGRKMNALAEVQKQVQDAKSRTKA